MNKQREQENYINYFCKWDGMGMLGLVLMVIGFLSLWLGIGFYLSVFLMPIGLGIFLYGSIGRAGESDFQNEIERRMEKIGFANVEEESRFRRRYAKEPTVYSFSGDVMEEGVMLKRKKSGDLCSSRYLCAKMMVLTDALYLKSRSFSFVEEWESAMEEEIFFADITSITVEREVRSILFRKASYMAKVCELVISCGEEKCYRLPLPDDIYAEEFAEKLGRLLPKKKEE